jgi:hypothetical protein
MATRQERLSEFNESVPPTRKPVQLLCEDHCGTYVAPFVCERRDGAWYRMGSDKPVEANVIGWRRIKANSRSRVHTPRLEAAARPRPRSKHGTPVTGRVFLI